MQWVLKHEERAVSRGAGAGLLEERMCVKSAMRVQKLPEVQVAGPRGFWEERLPLVSKAKGRTDTE